MELKESGSQIDAAPPIAVLPSANATAIPIQNASFEELVIAGSPGLRSGRFVLGNIPGWTVSSVAQTATGKPSTGTGGEFPAGIPDGVNVAAVGNELLGASISQTLVTTLQPNTVYELSVGVGHRIDFPFANYRIELAAGSNVLVSDSSLNPPAGQFLRDVITFTSNSASVGLGQPLKITLSSLSAGYQVDFDNVVLTATPADVTPPIVTAFVPADEGTDVAVTANIVLTFSEAVVRGTGNVVLKTALGQVVAVYDVATSNNLSVAGSTVTVDPSGNLSFGTKYFLDLDAGSLKDLAGNAFIGTTSYNFTTAAGDTTPPSVTSFSPADEATAVSIGTNIQLTFSESIQRGSGNIVLKTAAGQIVASFDAATSANLSIAGGTLTVDPSVDLAFSTQYFLDFDGGSIKDLANNPYAGTRSYNFTTIAAALTLAGTEANDVLVGGPANDALSGGGGRDTLTGGGGNDLLNGGDGIDEAVFSGQRSQYDLANSGLGWLATDRRGQDGQDTLVKVERLRFADTNLALDLSGNAGLVAKTLGAVFGAAAVHNAGYVGIGLNLVDAGMSVTDLMRLALDARLGDHPSNTAVVTLLYTNVAGAPPSQGDVSALTSLLSAGTFTQESLAAFAADHALNLANIDLVGLLQSGLMYQ